VKIAKALLYKTVCNLSGCKCLLGGGFGDNPFGVYMAMVDDVIHFDELGKIAYVTEAFLQPFSDIDSTKLDPLVEKVLNRSTLQWSAHYHQPRLNYHCGYYLSLLTASEHVGIMFACFIIFHTRKGEALA
jgi:hypothetical protein